MLMPRAVRTAGYRFTPLRVPRSLPSQLSLPCSLAYARCHPLSASFSPSPNPILVFSRQLACLLYRTREASRQPTRHIPYTRPHVRPSPTCPAAIAPWRCRRVGTPRLLMTVAGHNLVAAPYIRATAPRPGVTIIIIIIATPFRVPFPPGSTFVFLREKGTGARNSCLASTCAAAHVETC